MSRLEQSADHLVSAVEQDHLRPAPPGELFHLGKQHQDRPDPGPNPQERLQELGEQVGLVDQRPLNRQNNDSLPGSVLLPVAIQVVAGAVATPS